jgi:hypothetical protein
VSAPWLLEPDAQLEARTARESAPGEHEIELSKAISLKRLADAFSGLDFQMINNWAQTIAWEAGRSFEHGRKQ